MRRRRGSERGGGACAAVAGAPPRSPCRGGSGSASGHVTCESCRRAAVNDESRRSVRADSALWRRHECRVQWATPRVQSAAGAGSRCARDVRGGRVPPHHRRAACHSTCWPATADACVSGGRRSPWAGTCALAVPAPAVFRSRAKLACCPAQCGRRRRCGAASSRVVSKPAAQASWSRRTSRATTSSRRAWCRTTGRRLSSHEPNAGTTPSSSSTI